MVGGAWIAVSLLGTLPYVLTPGALGPVDAFFESVSGFTTTGSTVIGDTTVLPRSLLLWRAMSQWLGGMGIILFTIAILPLLGIGGMQLFKAEVPGPVADKVQPRLANTARSLWGVYVALTAVEWVLLRIAGLDTFEALCHSFTTLATGGFSTRNASVGEFGSAAVEWIVIVFMLAAGINFVLHYRILVGRGREVLRDAELRYFLGVVVGFHGLLHLHHPSGRRPDRRHHPDRRLSDRVAAHHDRVRDHGRRALVRGSSARGGHPVDPRWDVGLHRRRDQESAHAARPALAEGDGSSTHPPARGADR